MGNIIEVSELEKSYGSVRAVRGIDFSVDRGTLFAFLGPNGAGKSTTIDMVCTLLAPDSGKVVIDGCILGKDDAAIRRTIGVVFQDHVLDPLLTVRENLLTRARFYGIAGSAAKEAANAAAEAAGAAEFADRRYGKLSGGQKRRADIARALVNTPKILFLDEPTTGLDPKTKGDVWRTITELQRETGMTVFLTTHYMEEAAAADYITIIDNGEIAVHGTPYELEERYSTDTMRLKPKDREGLISYFQSHGIEYKEKNGIISLDIDDSLTAIPMLDSIAAMIEGFEVVHGTMEDVFIRVTGKEAEDHA